MINANKVSIKLNESILNYCTLSTSHCFSKLMWVCLPYQWPFHRKVSRIKLRQSGRFCLPCIGRIQMNLTNITIKIFSKLPSTKYKTLKTYCVYNIMPYSANVWWTKSLANLMNHCWFANFYQSNLRMSNVTNCSLKHWSWSSFNTFQNVICWIQMACYLQKFVLQQ